MVSYGVVALNHDAALAVLDDGELLFFKRASEYSGVPNDFFLNEAMLSDAFSIATPDRIGFFENPYLKKYRQLKSGQFRLAFDVDFWPSLYLRRVGFKDCGIDYHEHHKSHVAYAKYQLGFADAVYLVADAIGELDTISIWQVCGNKFSKLYSKKYPFSLGLFYSAFTKFAGLRPLADENKFMNLSLHGNPKKYKLLVETYLNKNLHRGVLGLDPSKFDAVDLAASVQEIFQDQLLKLVAKCQMLCPGMPIAFVGGCAYNSLAVNLIQNVVPDFCTVPDPGDARSSIGAAYLTYVRGAR